MSSSLENPPSSPSNSHPAQGRVDPASVDRAKAERRALRAASKAAGRKPGRPSNAAVAARKAENAADISEASHKRNVKLATSFIRQGNKGWRSSEKSLTPYVEPGELQWDDEEVEFGAESMAGTAESLDPSGKVARYLPPLGLAIFAFTTIITRALVIAQALRRQEYDEKHGIKPGEGPKKDEAVKTVEGARTK